MAPSCDCTSCTRHEKSSITVYYVFPSWILQRILIILLCSSRRDGPFMSLRPVNIRSGSDQVFFWAGEGYIAKIRILFKNGEASPFDVKAENYGSLLTVCTYWNHSPSSPS